MLYFKNIFLIRDHDRTLNRVNFARIPEDVNDRVILVTFADRSRNWQIALNS